MSFPTEYSRREKHDLRYRPAIRRLGLATVTSIMEGPPCPRPSRPYARLSPSCRAPTCSTSPGRSSAATPAAASPATRGSPTPTPSSLRFSGREIMQVDTPAGDVVTVTLEEVVDAFVRTFTILVPKIQIGLGDQVEFDAVGIETVDRSGAFVPAQGPKAPCRPTGCTTCTVWPSGSRSDHRGDRLSFWCRVVGRIGRQLGLQLGDDRFRPGRGEGTHVLHIFRGVTPCPGEPLLQVVGEQVDHIGAVALLVLPLQDLLTDGPVRCQHLGVRRAHRAAVPGGDVVADRVSRTVYQLGIVLPTGTAGNPVSVSSSFILRSLPGPTDSSAGQSGKPRLLNRLRVRPGLSEPRSRWNTAPVRKVESRRLRYVESQ